MSYDVQDTIAAVATAPAGAARGVVRVSGPDSRAVLERCFRGPSLAGVASPTVFPRTIPLGDPLGELPCDLYYWPSERSYTRQPSAEVHSIGSPPLLAAVLRRLCQCGARLARPGEFTLRAFLAGRLDLTQAEAVLGVIEARGQADLDAALVQLAGGLATPLKHLRSDLLDLLADLEAGLDFADEDIQFIGRNILVNRLRGAAMALAEIADRLRLRGGAADEPRVALIGEPNAGKSRLFNALSGADRAIVSPLAGTTRDYLASRIDCDGLRCLLLDTAGVEQEYATDRARSLAQFMTRREGESAQLTLLCLDSTRPLTALEKTWLADPPGPVPRLYLWTKRDAAAGDWRPKLAPHAIVTSAATGVGLEELRAAIARTIASSAGGGAAIGTSLRCRESVATSTLAIERAITAALSDSGDELIAAELRLALGELGQVAGAVYTDDVLDRIFSRFCIGK